MSSHYVYLVAHSSETGPKGPVKIGVSRSLETRLATLQTGNWALIECVNAISVSSRDEAMAIEREAHAVLSDDRMAGEWFAVDPARASTVLSAAASAVADHCFFGGARG